MQLFSGSFLRFSYSIVRTATSPLIPYSQTIKIAKQLATNAPIEPKVTIRYDPAIFAIKNWKLIKKDSR